MPWSRRHSVLAETSMAVRECYVLNSIIYLVFTASLALCVFDTPAYAEDDWDKKPSKIEVDRNVVYMSGATIISLATFGSILGIRVRTNRKTFRSQSIAFGMIWLGTIAIIWIQGSLMIYACCLKLDPSLLHFFLLGTCATLVAIITGVVIIHGPSRDQASDLAKSGSTS